MLSFIKETTNVWDYLKNDGRPIVMYGMGDGALKIMRVFEQYGIKISEFFASDEFVRGHSFMGYKVKRLSEIEEEYDDFIVVMAFAIFDEPMTRRIKEIAKRHTLLAPDVPVAGDNLFTYEYALSNAHKINNVYESLADDWSRKVYADIINFKISGKISYLSSCETVPDEAYNNILRLNENESFADLGAYHGETILEFLSQTNGKSDGIIALEPDAKNFSRMERELSSRGIKARLINKAIYSHEAELYFLKKSGRNSSISSQKTEKSIVIPADSLDNIAKGERISFVNMDVEGYEKEALLGMRETIKRYKTKLLVACYHRSEDIFELPLLALELNPSYKLYFRHYRYIPAWDTNLYCV